MVSKKIVTLDGKAVANATNIRKEGDIITARIEPHENKMLDKLLHQPQSFSIAFRGFKGNEDKPVITSFDLVSNS